MTERLLDLDAFSRTTMRSWPYQWTLVPGLLRADQAPALAAEYPPDGFTHAERTAGAEKHYRFSVLSLVKQGRPLAAVDALTPRWQRLIEDLRAPEYIQALSRLVGMSIDHLVMDIGLFRFGPGDWVEPHTDKPHKRVTQVIYFNRDWDPAWGGMLQVLPGKDDERGGVQVEPVASHCFVLIRNEQSWHAVSRLTPAAQAPRMTMQVELWEPDAP